MTRLHIDLSPDRMAARVRVDAGPPATGADVDAALLAAGVVFGVDEALYQRVAAGVVHGDYTLPSTLLASGRPPERGSDGVFVPDFRVGIQPGRARADGTLDFQDRDLVKWVLAGQRVGTMVAPALGNPGIGVDGIEVPAIAGRPASFRLGPGVKDSPHGDVTAVVAGAVVYVAGRSVDVTQHYEHQGSVDLHSGHLTMEGGLTISGDVASGFRVRAAGDVDVAGRCEGEIHAGGDLRVAGVIRGGGVTAQGEVLARAAESVRVEAGSALSLHDAVHGELQAATITVEKQLRGGRAQAERWVRAGEAGSVAGTPTLLHAGCPRLTPDELKARLAESRGQRAAQRGQSREGGVKPGRDGGALAGTVERTLERARRRDELAASAFIEVRGTVYAGTTLQIGERTHTVQVDTRGLRVSLDPDQPQLRLERTLP